MKNLLTQKVCITKLIGSAFKLLPGGNLTSGFNFKLKQSRKPFRQAAGSTTARAASPLALVVLLHVTLGVKAGELQFKAKPTYRGLAFPQDMWQSGCTDCRSSGKALNRGWEMKKASGSRRMLFWAVFLFYF